MLCPDEMGILPLTNEWPESLMVADRSHMVMPSSSNSSTTSTPDTAARHPTGPLKCPRCDSPNTKFCYYNNYSLSQPRHFCKACKRYWTRGGTLRNVPVGGGCRKNKRVKKTPTSTDSPTLTLPLPPINSPTKFSNTTDINPNFFCNLSNTISYPNLQQRMQEYYDLQPQMKASLGFGFTPTTDDQYPHHFRANITDSTAVSSATKDYYYPLFGSSSATAASLLVSSLKQPRKIEEYQSLINYNDQQLNGNLGLLLNQVKVEGEANNTFDWQLSCEAPFDTMSAVAASASAATSAPIDSSFMYWNGAASGNWPEGNYGSSITPLI